jgi:hypothetical protein
MESIKNFAYRSKTVRDLKVKLLYHLFYLPELGFPKNLTPPKGLITENICLPPLHAFQDHDDITPLFTLVAELSPRIVVEFGTAHGNTAANICKLTNAKIITVNALPEQLSGNWVTFSLPIEEIGRVYREHGFSDRVVQVYENTLNVDLSKYVFPDTVDIGIIDACHDSSYVISDFLKTAPYIRQGGVVLFHDTHPCMRGHLAGSYLACIYLRRKGWNIQHIQNTWWGIWVKGGLKTSKVGNLLLPPPRWPLWNYLRRMN